MFDKRKRTRYSLSTLRTKKENVTAYITKYGLTQGILVCEGTEFTEKDTYFAPKNNRYMHYRLGKEYFHTQKEALAHVEIMRQNKIKSLEKQITKYKTYKPNLTEVA
jgi:hypothetical protein